MLEGCKQKYITIEYVKAMIRVKLHWEKKKIKEAMNGKKFTSPRNNVKKWAHFSFFLAN